MQTTIYPRVTLTPLVLDDNSISQCCTGQPLDAKPRGLGGFVQVQREGSLADSMAVSVLLMQLYIFKFFLCAPRQLAYSPAP